MQLTNNDWLFLNDLIFKINSIRNTDQMRSTLLSLIRAIIPCDHLTFFIADQSGDSLMKSPVQIGFADELVQDYIHKYEKIDYKHWIFASGKSAVYRLTDLYPPGVREKLPYYQTVHTQNNIHYEAILSLAYNDKFVGVVSLFRTKDEQDFSDYEISILDIIKDHLACRLYADLEAEAEEAFNSNSDFALPYAMDSYGLTKRELDVLALMVQGKQNKFICNELFITTSTLKKHSISIYRKLGICNRMELFKFLA